MAEIFSRLLLVFIWCFVGYKIFPNVVVAELFCSLAEMKTLYNLEEIFPNLMDEYLKAEEERLQKIIQTVANFEQSRFYDFNDSESILNNPINIYHLIKRYSVDMKMLLNLIETPNFKVFNTSNNTIKNFPDRNDLNGVAIGINRLKLTYNLTMSSLVKGEISPKSKSEKQLSADDCLQIAKELYSKRFYDLSAPWFEEVLKIESTESDKTVERKVVLDYLSFTYYKMGNNTKAHECVKEILDIDPNYKNAKKNELYYRAAKQKIPILKFTKSDQDWDNIKDTYLKLCRNEQLQDLKKTSKFKCYLKNNSPYLLLQPAKIEDVHFKPRIAFLHDVLRDNEIKLFQEFAFPNLARAKVGITGVVNTAPYRISKIAWLKDNRHPAVLSLSKRLQEITGLEVVNGSEELQMNNYGIGGHYESHCDFSKNVSHIVTGTGNRIATILIYMNDVIAGGNTVFPRLKLSVAPIKGSAVFWHNLFHTGEGNELTLHAACPVLAGTKWVCNKWIKQYPQMFRKPCGLKETENYTDIMQ